MKRDRLFTRFCSASSISHEITKEAPEKDFRAGSALVGRVFWGGVRQGFRAIGLFRDILEVGKLEKNRGTEVGES